MKNSAQLITTAKNQNYARKVVEEIGLASVLRSLSIQDKSVLGSLAQIFEKKELTAEQAREKYVADDFAVKDFARLLIGAKSDKYADLNPDFIASMRKKISIVDIDKLHSGTKAWLAMNAKDIFLGSNDLENTKKMVEETGLGNIVRRVSDSSVVDSSGWWAQREVLKSFSVGRVPVGLKVGLKAKDLFNTTNIQLIHETTNAERYFSLTAHQGESKKINAFVSRVNAVGESAAFGDGFYLVVNRKDQVRGYAIQVNLHPEAVEGIDFIHRDGKVILLNAAAAILSRSNSAKFSLEEFNKLIQEKNHDKSRLATMTLDFLKALASYSEAGRVKIEKDISETATTESLEILKEVAQYWKRQSVFGDGSAELQFIQKAIGQSPRAKEKSQSDFAAYESIAKATTSAPSILINRNAPDATSVGSGYYSFGLKKNIIVECKEFFK